IVSDSRGGGNSRGSTGRHWVNSAPIRRRSLVEEGSTHVIVGRHGSYRAAWSGNWPGRSLGTKSALGGRAILQAVTRVKLEQAAKVKLWMPTRLLTAVLCKMCFANAARHPALAAGMGLCSQQQVQELQVGQALLFRPGQQFIQRRRFQGNAQCGAVAQTLITQRGRRRGYLGRLLFHRHGPFPPSGI